VISAAKNDTPLYFLSASYSSSSSVITSIFMISGFNVRMVAVIFMAMAEVVAESMWPSRRGRAVGVLCVRSSRPVDLGSVRVVHKSF